jgi:uncharacterized protein involved in exopolysaccharide biosynthesis
MSAAQIGADDQGVVDIGDLLRILWRGKYIIMVGAIAGLFFGGWFGANKVAPTYTAYAVVVKSSESSPMASLGLDFNLGASGFKSDYQEIIKEQHVLKSRYLMGRASTLWNWSRIRSLIRSHPAKKQKKKSAPIPRPSGR